MEPSEESEKRRFEVECEFVQALANPNYLNFLAQRGYFKEDYFVNYLRYLLYWKEPQYASFGTVEFLKSQNLGPSAKYVEDQVVLQWQFYLRKRHRLCMMPEEEETGGGEEAMEVDEKTSGGGKK
uniref:Mediator of RNA polymerase II transcription subunit 31 n=1 Tax=Caenorhabditis japonica TaxID=281687 RepID=A0A8R1E3U2_CAEJA